MGNGVVYDDKPMSHEQHLKILTLQYNRIAAGAEFWAYDDTAVGNKSTGCNWGLCLSSKEIYPDIDMNLFPEHFKQYDRIAPKHRVEGQKCPLETMETPKDFIACGCFYRCQVFRKEGVNPTKEEALLLYKTEIEKWKKIVEERKRNASSSSKH